MIKLLIQYKPIDEKNVKLINFTVLDIDSDAYSYVDRHFELSDKGKCFTYPMNLIVPKPESNVIKYNEHDTIIYMNINDRRTVLCK